MYASRSTKSSPKKWRPPFLLFSGAKKVVRHKMIQINGLCLESPTPSTRNGGLLPSKNRQFSPFFPGGFRGDSLWSLFSDRQSVVKRLTSGSPRNDLEKGRSKPNCRWVTGDNVERSACHGPVCSTNGPHSFPCFPPTVIETPRHPGAHALGFMISPRFGGSKDRGPVNWPCARRRAIAGAVAFAGRSL